MSAHGPDRHPRTPWFGDRFRVLIASIVVFQALWMWATIKRGWYLQSDLSNLADTTDRSLSWQYLRSPLGGHFSPVLRLAYWLMQAIDPMSYELTIVLRILLQSAAVVLLAIILLQLAGRHVVVLAVLAGYSLSSLTLPGVTFMTTGVAFGIAQLLCLAALLVVIRFSHSGRFRDGLLAGALIALATLASEQFIVYGPLAALVALGFCYRGSAAERLSCALRSWPGWLAMAAPVLAAAVLALLGADTKGAGGLHAGDLWPLLKTEWLRAIGPTLIGGPFRWFGDRNTYAAFYAPTDATVLLGQLAVVVLIFLGWYFTGWRALLAWALPVLAAVGGIVLVAAARYGVAGQLIPITPRYSFVVAAPLAMAVCLSLVSPTASPRRLELAIPARLVQAVPPAALLGLALVVGMCLSSVRYTQFWSRNPGRTFAQTLVASVRAAGPKVNLYDTPLPAGMVSSVEPNHHLSDLLRLLDVRATFDQPTSSPLVATADGRLVKAAFLPAAIAAGKPIPGCGTHLKGAGPFEIALNKPARTNEWFLHLEFYQKAASTVSVKVLDRFGHARTPTTGALVGLPKLAAVNLRLPSMAPAKVVISTVGTPIDICLAKVQVGGPFAAAGS